MNVFLLYRQPCCVAVATTKSHSRTRKIVIAKCWTFAREQWKRDWAARWVVWQLLLSLEYQLRSMVADVIKTHSCCVADIRDSVKVRPFHFLFPIYLGEIYFELATTLLNLHFWWPRFDFVVVPVIHRRINLSSSWTWTEIGCLAISVRARFWFASRYFNSINLQSFNVLNAKQHSKLTHYCVLTNLKRFGESKTSRFQKISLRLLWQPFTVLFT